MNKTGDAHKMKEAFLVAFLDIYSNSHPRDFTDETAFMIFPSQFLNFMLLYFMQFNNVLVASGTGEINSA